MSARTHDQRYLPGERPDLPAPVDPFATPPLRVWISTFWGDILGLACMGALALGLHLASPVPSRTFPITFQDGEIVFPQFAYEPRRQIIPIWAAVLLSAGVPILFFFWNSPDSGSINHGFCHCKRRGIGGNYDECRVSGFSKMGYRWTSASLLGGL